EELWEMCCTGRTDPGPRTDPGRRRPYPRLPDVCWDSDRRDAVIFGTAGLPVPCLRRSTYVPVPEKDAHRVHLHDGRRRSPGKGYGIRIAVPADCDAAGADLRVLRLVHGDRYPAVRRLHKICCIGV